jgi:hypothetical protein
VERVNLIEKMINVSSILVGKPERKRVCPESRPKWEDDIKICLKDTTFGLYSTA